MSNIQIKDKRPGFFMIYNDVLDQYGADIGPYGIAIYNALCRYADKDGSSHPSYETLAQMTGMSKRQAQRAMDKLIEYKLIAKVTNNEGKSNIYHILNTPQRTTDSHGGTSVSHGGGDSQSWGGGDSQST